MVCLFTCNNIKIFSQDCKKFHLYGTCMQNPGPSFRVDGQSRSSIIGIGDKFTYNVILYEKRDYKLYFCATDLFNPVHYILKDYVTSEVIYDSQKDQNPETVELSTENTRRIMIEVSVLATNAEKQVTDNFFGCIGFLLQWRAIRN